MTTNVQNLISEERRIFLRRIKNNKLQIQLARYAILISFFGLWEISAKIGLIDPFIMSSPTRIVRTIARLIVSGNLFQHIGITCMETAIGFLLGTFFGTVIAILLWWSPKLSTICEPFLVILNSLPKIALGPIFIVWLGPGTGAIITMGLAISVIVTILEVHNGFCTTDSEKIKLALSLGGNRFQVLQKVVLPSNVGAIVSALKVNVGLSWVGVIVGEYLVSKGGLGYLIVYGGQVFQLDLVMASVVILGALAALMYFGVVWIEKKILS